MSREAMKYTSGPWVVDPAVRQGFTVYAPKERFIVGTQDEEGRYGAIESEANARLIAAAPDLLEALKDLLDEAEWLRREYSHDRERDGWDALEEDPCFTVARAAIAKATGGEV